MSSIEDLKKYEGLVYMATPYSKFRGGPTSAFHAACWVAADLIRAGVNVFSPIVHSHPIGTFGQLDILDLEMWLKVDRPFMDAAEACVVVMLPGWHVSTGVQHEIEYFLNDDKVVYYLDPETMVVTGPAPIALEEAA